MGQRIWPLPFELTLRRGGDVCGGLKSLKVLGTTELGSLTKRTKPCNEVKRMDRRRLPLPFELTLRRGGDVHGGLKDLASLEDGSTSRVELAGEEGETQPHGKPCGEVVVLSMTDRRGLMNGTVLGHVIIFLTHGV